MNHANIIIAASVAAVFSIAHAEPASLLPASNPFAKPSTLPFGYPAFDKIKNEDYAPAFEEGMRQQAAEIDAIANNKKPATFDNTIVAMEKGGQLLNRVSTVFYSLSGANTNDTFKALERELSPKLAAHNDAIRLNGKLYARIKSLYDKRDKLHLDAESKYLLERYHTDFVRAGAQLSDADKAKLKAMNGELAKLQTTFAQNVLEEANASALVVDTREELAGMSDKAIDAAAAAAKAKGQDGKFLIPVVNTTGQANLAVLTNRAVREKLMALSLARGSHGGKFDNTQVVLSLVKLRAEKAALMGYPNFAAYALADQTAHDTDSVNKILAELTRPAVANARKEGAEIQQAINKENGGFELAAHDWAMYSDKVKAERFNFDSNELRPYFELNNVLTNGVFFAANKVYGLSFKERKDLPVYNPDVRVFDVFDADGKQLAIFIADFYARSNKRGGAWMNAYVSQSSLMGTRPVVANHLNIPKPNDGEPTLLTYDELRTMFHEFGHALHGMFSNVKYPRFSGTRVPRDYVEFPSQVNEMWSVWPEVLSNYAKHYQTGAPMPKELLDKVIASKKFNEGFRTTEYLAASILDQKWHQLGVNQIPTDVLGFEAAALKDAGINYAPVPPRYRTTYFSHTFAGGYSAGYYGYVWAEKLDADAVEWFIENGGMQRKNGDYFRKMLLSKGGTLDAMQMYRNFRGRDATIQPLLERRGLTEK
ncbi:peptidyl-dipeptidase Dcp [Duganella sp. CF402]|uniref:M3 family metallopeptidase n=1 Tax=unclassified Duganella TaxID=2636909 RepID=UPI0008D2B8FB|nr:MULTISPECIES: M3 family metallopeptidase [unclassified Duganella]RZT05467.1 peptidyl-dipeptidase Dcp [Duganella sp. BK701]SEN03004.1 peptidyl-dipeptidase Dcp [Duganella sp. CF402]